MVPIGQGIHPPRRILRVNILVSMLVITLVPAPATRSGEESGKF